MSCKASLNMYVALVRSQLEYGVQVWGPWDLKWEKAEAEQIRWLRKWFGLRDHCSPLSILLEVRLWPLSYRRQYLRLCFLWSLVRGKPHLLHVQLFNALLTQFENGLLENGSWLIDVVNLLSR